MQAMMNSMSSSDIRQWLDNGYVSFEGRVWRYYDVAENNRVGLIRNDEEQVWADLCNVYVHWPLCGALNVHGAEYAIFAQRKQSRQWRRTYNPRELNLFVPGEWAIRKKIPRNELTSHLPNNLIAEAAFDPKYPTLQQAIGKIRRHEKLSVALSPMLTLTEEALFHKTLHVANRDDDTGLYPVVPQARLSRMIKQVGGFTLCG